MLQKNLIIITYEMKIRYTVSKILKKIKGKKIVYSLARHSLEQLLFAVAALVCGFMIVLHNQETKW